LLFGCDNSATLPSVADSGSTIDGRVFSDGGSDLRSRDAMRDGMARDAMARDTVARDAAARDIASPPKDATSPDLAQKPLRIYMAANGNDSRDGSSKSKAIKTLQRAQAILVAKNPTRDVEIRIAPGTYYGQTVVWTFSMPNHEVKLMPRDDDKNRPVFDGCLEAGATPSSCPGGQWFTLKHSRGQRTNLHFSYIQVQNYGTAISFNGNRNDEKKSNGGNTIYGCYFKRIGNIFNPSLSPATAAVRLVNSDDNTIANNHFIDIVNTKSAGLIHSLYIAHMSDRNVIRANRFKDNSGDPIRLRDFSNDNQITDNKLTKVGTAGYSEWYCDHEARTDCTKPAPECSSWNNAFRNNTLDGDYACQPLRGFVYDQDDTTAGCTKPSGAKRLSTSGNTKTNTPCSL
jgi:hypothetical protein